MNASTLGPVGGPADPGLQGERTGLAWVRTSLTVAANAALIGRAGIVEDVAGLVAASVLLAMIATALAFIGWHRHVDIERQVRASVNPARPRLMALATIATVLAAFAVLASVLLGNNL
ncbi:MAG: DUF202 domain-containing protein [Nostocoides sp.]